MTPLVVPLLAQLVSLQLGDRTEGRYLYERFEGSTSPLAALTVTGRRHATTVGYTPSFTLLPLERRPRELLVYHQGYVDAGYDFRRTKLQLSSGASWGEVNFRFFALQDQGAQADIPSDPGGSGDAPVPDAGTPGAQPPNVVTQPTVEDRTVKYFTSTTALTLTHDASRRVSLSAQAGSIWAGGMDADARRYYPALHSWFVGGTATHTYKLSAHDAFASSLTLRKLWSSNGNEVASGGLLEVWTHAFGKQTSGLLGAGLNISRFSQPSGLAGFSVFPDFRLGLTHDINFRAGMFTVSATVFSRPALDPLRALVDPRVGVSGNILYTLDRFSVNASGSAAFSVAPEDNDDGAVSSSTASATAGYRVGDAALFEVGARYVFQAYQGVTVLAPTYALFARVSVVHDWLLVGQR